MALTFAQWTKKELQPAARWRYFSGVKTIRQGSSYSCRRIAGSRTQSAHRKGNALDVMAIELNNGKQIDVRKKSLFSFRERKLLNNVRADGCEYFTTVLGPGYNYDHRNHFHFDLMHRKSGPRLPLSGRESCVLSAKPSNGIPPVQKQTFIFFLYLLIYKFFFFLFLSF